MGDIIKVNFGGGVENKKDERPKPVEQGEAAADFIPFVPNVAGEKGGFASFEQVKEKLTALRQFLERMPAPARDTAALRQEMVSKMTFVQICNAIAYSSEASWRVRPAYFRALADKLFAKLKAKGPTLPNSPAGSNVPEKPEKE